MRDERRGEDRGKLEPKGGAFKGSDVVCPPPQGEIADGEETRRDKKDASLLNHVVSLLFVFII